MTRLLLSASQWAKSPKKTICRSVFLLIGTQNTVPYCQKALLPTGLDKQDKQANDAHYGFKLGSQYGLTIRLFSLFLKSDF